MPTYVDLNDLSRRELEDVLLTFHGAYLETLRAVRQLTEPGWKVRREVERIAQETANRRPFARAFVRSVETRQDRVQAAVNAARWDNWQAVAP